MNQIHTNPSVAKLMKTLLGCLLENEFTVSAMGSVQPKDVQLLIGDSGCNLTGTYISSSKISGKTVEFQQIITIGK